jgi:hypothetical protein
MRHDPQGACRSAARAAKCRPDALFLTGEDERTLHPGLHACHVDTVYDWKLAGEIPTPRMVSNLSMWQVDGALWPLSASLERRALDRFQAGRVREAAAALRRMDDRTMQDAAGALERLAAIPHGRADPLVWVQHLPLLSELGEGERYMLHHWLLQPSSSDADHVMAHPVWYVVQAVLQDHRLEAWQVVRKDVCGLWPAGNRARGPRLLPQAVGGRWVGAAGRGGRRGGAAMSGRSAIGLTFWMRRLATKKEKPGGLAFPRIFGLSLSGDYSPSVSTNRFRVIQKCSTSGPSFTAHRST